MAKKISNGLLTLSSAAILAVYAAGYERTNPAAERFAAQLAQRRAPVPVVERVAAAPLPVTLSTVSDVKPRTETKPETTAPKPKAPTAAPEPAQTTVASETPTPVSEPAPVEPATTAHVAEPVADHTQAPGGRTSASL